MKILMKAVYERLNKDRQLQLLQYIFKVQGAELKRLDFSAAARELNANRAQISRDVQALEKAKLIVISNGALCIAKDILTGE